jgi:hypothetical protein
LDNLPVDPDKLRLPINPWIIDHNAEEHAIEHFLDVIADIRNGNTQKYRYSANILEDPWVNLDTGEVTDKRLLNPQKS